MSTDIRDKLIEGAPEKKVAVLRALGGHNASDEILEEVCRLLESSEHYEEAVLEYPSYAHIDVVRVRDEAARAVRRVGIAALEPLLRALAIGAGALASGLASQLLVGKESQLSDHQLATAQAIVDRPQPPRTPIARRLARRLDLEARRRHGGAADPAHLETLAGQLASEDPDTRADALWGLGLARGSQRAAEIALAAIQSGVRAGPSLMAVGPVLDAAGLDAMLELVAPPDGRVDLLAAVAQYRDPRVDTILVGWLTSSVRGVWPNAACLLRDRGPVPEVARRQLLSTFAGPADPDGWRWAVIALGGATRLDDRERARMARRLEAEIASGGVGAVGRFERLLGDLGPWLGALVPRLSELLDEPPRAVAPVVRVLSRMGDAARPAVAHIAALLGQSGALDRVILIALERLGATAGEARPAVERYLASARTGRQRNAARQTLAALGSPTD